jgi:hypothetical protein
VGINAFFFSNNFQSSTNAYAEDDWTVETCQRRWTTIDGTRFTGRFGLCSLQILQNNLELAPLAQTICAKASNFANLLETVDCSCVCPILVQVLWNVFSKRIVFFQQEHPKMNVIQTIKSIKYSTTLGGTAGSLQQAVCRGLIGTTSGTMCGQVFMCIGMFDAQ